MKRTISRKTTRIGLAMGTGFLLMAGGIRAQAQTAPIAEAGGPYSGEVGEQLSFFGTASQDPDGVIGFGYWDFGDGSPPVSGLNTFHTYTASGTYTATLLVIDDDGLMDTDTATVTVTLGNVSPTADAGGPYLASTNIELTFDGTGSTDPDGTIVSYSWNFGDGSGTGSGAKPSYTYTTAGTYTVNLRVTDDDGAVDDHSTTVQVSETNYPPTADAGGPYTGQVGAQVAFFGNATDPNGGGDVVSFEWDFGDGSPKAFGLNAWHTYAADGNYTVTFTVMDAAGATGVDTTSATIGAADQPPVAVTNGPYSGTTGLPVEFNASGSSDPDGNIVSYSWNFGDGTTGTGEIANHTYATAGQWDVTLTVTDDDGLTDVELTYAVISQDNQAPVADAGGPYTGEATIAINFTGSAQDENVGAATAVWDFGDNSPTVAGFSTAHTYATEGIYQVTLTVTDELGLKSSDTTLALVGQGPQEPIASTGGPYLAKTGTTITFDGTASSDSDGEIVSYEWNFGDGTMGTGQKPTHSYSTVGNYDVTLTVTDNESLQGTSSTFSVIIQPNQAPTAVIEGPSSGNAGDELVYLGTASTDPDGFVETLIWSFGDGTFASGATAAKTYFTGGTYQLQLLVIDDEGAIDTAELEVTITGSVPVTINIEQGPNPGEVTVSWSPTTPTQVLQESPDMMPGSWVPSPSGSASPVTIPIGGKPKNYFRVFEP